MRPSLLGLLSFTLLMSACQAPTTSVATKAKKPAAAASVKPSAAPSAVNVAASTAPKAVPSVAATGQLLSGLLKMDASFVVSAGGGNVISAGGGNVISAGGGNLISVGGQVISAGGGNVISPGGGNVISPGGGNYRVAAVADATDGLLPAAGMAVVAVSLKTGLPISDAVLTDETGHYALRIPETEKGNVRVVAAVPAKSQDDPLLTNDALQSEMLTSARDADAEQVLDDDGTVVSRAFRKGFVGRLDDLLASESDASEDFGGPLVNALWAELVHTAMDAKTSKLPKADRKALAERLADNLTYYVDLKGARTDMAWPNWAAPKDELVMDGYTDLMRLIRRKTRAKLAANKQHFDGLAFLDGYAIKRPMDFGNFMIKKYLSKPTNEPEMFAALDAIGVDHQEAYHLKAAENGLRTAIGLVLLTNPEAKKAVLEIIKGGK